jgi:hypothetical protein
MDFLIIILITLIINLKIKYNNYIKLCQLIENKQEWKLKSIINKYKI